MAVKATRKLPRMMKAMRNVWSFLWVAVVFLFCFLLGIKSRLEEFWGFVKTIKRYHVWD